MTPKEFHSYRQDFQKTQKEISEVLGTSLKAVQSFEQGWRKIPVHIERQMLFLRAMKKMGKTKVKPCWETQKCSPETRRTCPAWEFHVENLCWFINGTLCRGKPQAGWSRKMNICRKCKVFAAAMKS